MRILSLQVYDKAHEWELQPLEFKNGLTLLVGASGAGKTRILHSIQALQNIAAGKVVSGFTWDISFVGGNGKHYRWRGEFEHEEAYSILSDLLNSDEKVLLPNNMLHIPVRILRENLYCDDEEILKRDEYDIYLNNKKVVKLSPEYSAVFLLKEEEQIHPVFSEFARIIVHGQWELPIKVLELFEAERLVEEYLAVEDIVNTPLSIHQKLFLLYQRRSPLFEDIKNSFIDVFHQVEDVNFEPMVFDAMPINGDVQSTTRAPIFLLAQRTPILQIKEKGVEKWIDQTRISAGMLKTLLHISEVYLCAKGTVILIDEFENSLGVNCINSVTSHLIGRRGDVQYILTSHHPYIINNIPHEHWKVVTRKGGVVHTHDASEFHIGKSKHEAFTQLLNLEEYQTGIEAE